MFSKLFFATLIVSAAWVAVAVPARANDCGTGYLERFDRRGEPFCLSEAKERANLLRQEQMLRRHQLEWRAELIRSRQDQIERQARLDQHRREEALN